MSREKAGLRMIGYCRVSTGKQAKSGLGLEAQRQKITTAAQLHGWEITTWKIDRGETGKNTHRPGFRQALQLIADGEADGLVAVKLDRVSRSVVDFSLLLDCFISGKKVLAILDPALDTSTPAGKLVANALASVAEFEADVIAERTGAALAVKRGSGLPICRASVVDQPVLAKRIRRMRDKGMSLGGIALKLNQEGVPTLRGGEKWRASSIETILGYQRPRTKKPTRLPTIRRKRTEETRKRRAA